VGASLVPASLTRASLARASLTRASLTRASLTRASLTRTSLARTSLARASVIAAVLLATLPAAAAGPTAAQQAAAAALFEDAKKLMADGKLDEACPKLAESQRLDPGMGTLFNLAVCYEKTNRTASAWVSYRDVAALAKAAGQAEREKLAWDKASALEPRLMRLKITVQPAAASAGVEVKRDGEIIAAALWGTGVPIDPGQHVVRASAPGKAPWEAAVTLDQAGKTVTIDVPALAEGSGARPPPPATTPPPPGPVAGPTVTPPPPVEAAPRPWQRPLGIAATAVGAVGLGLGVGFGLMAKSAFTTSNTSNCSEKTNVCNPTGMKQRDDALLKGNLGTGVFIAGAALAAGGVVLWATAPAARAQPRSGAWALPELAVGPGSVAVRGAF
jgi:serine/threonine-protein kinase